MASPPHSGGEKTAIFKTHTHTHTHTPQAVKKNTFLPLYFHFLRHFIYTHNVALEKQKGNQKGKTEAYEVMALNCAGQMA